MPNSGFLYIPDRHLSVLIRCTRVANVRYPSLPFRRVHFWQSQSEVDRWKLRQNYFIELMYPLVVWEVLVAAGALFSAYSISLIEKSHVLIASLKSRLHIDYMGTDVLNVNSWAEYELVKLSVADYIPRPFSSLLSQGTKILPLI